MNRCAKIRGCPASQYLNCPAWRASVDCWESDSWRCTSDMRLCLQYGCPVYERYPERIESALRARAAETLRVSRESKGD